MKLCIHRDCYRSVAACLAPLALAACGPDDGPKAESATAEQPVDPPGAALPLSIGYALEEPDGDALDRAIGCAAALEITSRRFAGMSSGGMSREIALMMRARNHFAEEATRESGAVAGSAQVSIARRVRESAGEPTRQAQRAIACLRQFGEQIG